MHECIRCGKTVDTNDHPAYPYCSTWCLIVADRHPKDKEYQGISTKDTKCLHCGIWFHWDNGYSGAHCSTNCLKLRKLGVPPMKDEDVAWEDMEKG